MENDIQENNNEYKSDNECIDEDLSKKKNNKIPNPKRIPKPKKDPTPKQLETFKKLREKRKQKWQEVKKIDMKEEIEEQLIQKLNHSLQDNIIPQQLPPAQIKPIQELPVEYKPPQRIINFEEKKLKPNSVFISSELTYTPYFLQVEKNTMKNKKKLNTSYSIPTFDNSIYR